ncbi:MAG: phage major capsid protein [Clostridia bacterium]|nr:phage major capsid protein [Clostridia bacterium]
MTIKALLEKKEDLKAKMKGIVDTAKAENRELTEDEVKNFDETEKTIKDIEATIERMEKVENLETKTPKVEDKKELTQEEKDVKAFATFIRNKVSGITNEVDVNLTKSDNGVIIPKTIAKKIVDKVKEISPLYASATKYDGKGTLAIPKYDDTTDDVTVAYANEFDELVSHSGKFGTVELTGFLIGALTKISKSLLKNSDLNLTNYVVDKMARKFKLFYEGEMLNGTTNKISGIVGSYNSENMKIVLGAKSSLASDELIDIQESVPDDFQVGAYWIMHRQTRKAIRKLKDSDGNYILNRAFNEKWDYELLGKPVYCSEKVAKLGTASKPVIFYGDFSGLAVKETEEMEIQVLVEKFATQHAIGVCGYSELDAKVENTQKIAVAVTGTSDTAATKA